MILREFFATLGLNVNEAEFAKGELAASLVKASLEKLVDIAKEAVTGFIDLVKGTAEAGKEIEETAQATGLTTKSLQELRAAARGAGVDTETLDTSMFKLSRSMYAAKKGGEEQQKTFAKLKVKVTDAKGELKDADDVLLGVASAFQKMPDGAEKTALAMEVFGRSGARLIPMLNKGEEGINELRKSAFIMSEEQIRAGKELTETQRKLANLTKSIWRSAVGPLLPAINNLLKKYYEWQKANAGLIKQQIQKYIGYVIKAINLLADGFMFVAKNIKFFEIAAVTAFGLIALAGADAAVRTLAAWLLAAAPFVLIGGLVAGLLLLFDDFRVYQKGGKSLFGLWKKTIDEWLKPKEDDVWFLTAIKDFVRLIRDAIKLLDEFYEAMGMVNPRTVDKKMAANKGQMDLAAYAETSKSARRQAEAGLPLSDAQKGALQAHGVDPDKFMAAHAPGPWAQPAVQATTVDARQQTNHITAVMAPGQSTEDFAKQVSDMLDAQWSDAAAATGQ
jgi:Phage-related minor tail protein